RLGSLVGQPDSRRRETLSGSRRKDHGYRQGGRRAFSAFAERPEVGRRFHHQECPYGGCPSRTDRDSDQRRRSLELIPVAAYTAIEAERQEARRARASTD